MSRFRAAPPRSAERSCRYGAGPAVCAGVLCPLGRPACFLEAAGRGGFSVCPGRPHCVVVGVHLRHSGGAAGLRRRPGRAGGPAGAGPPGPGGRFRVRQLGVLYLGCQQRPYAGRKPCLLHEPHPGHPAGHRGVPGAADGPSVAVRGGDVHGPGHHHPPLPADPLGGPRHRRQLCRVRRHQKGRPCGCRCVRVF